MKKQLSERELAQVSGGCAPAPCGYRGGVVVVRWNVRVVRRGFYY